MRMNKILLAVAACLILSFTSAFASEAVNEPEAQSSTPAAASSEAKTSAKSTPTARRTGYTRSEIRSMPILERPSRPGHFYGNTVRRRHGI